MHRTIIRYLQRPVTIAVALSWLSLVLADDSLKSQLRDAVNALQQQEAYRWTQTLELSRRTRFRPGPTNGQTTNDGLTVVTRSFGGRESHVVINGDKAAVTGRDGQWVTLSLLDQGYRSQGFAATMARSVQTPAEEVLQILESASGLERKDSAFVCQLSENQARIRLAGRRRDEDDFANVKGSASFWIRDGLLVKYRVRAEGKVQGRDEPQSQETTVEIKLDGAPQIDLPDGAAAALRRTPPKPQPRPSEEQASRILKRYGKRDVRVHDPSTIVRCGKEYWFFSTGNGVSSFRADDLKEWREGPRVFKEMPPWVRDVVPTQRGYFWAPDVIHHNGRYLLYYSVSRFGVNTSAIALASTPTLDPEDPDFGWKDHGVVIQTSRDDDFNAIDPAVIETDEGRLWMSFGSYWSGLKLVELDPETGKRLADAPLHSLAHYRAIEAPHIYHHDGYYYLFVNWDNCCRGVDSTYNIRVGRSRKITGPYVDKRGVDLMEGGGTLLLSTEGPFIGPGHASIFRRGDRHLLSCHYYDGTNRGRSMLSIQPIAWDDDGWPTVGSNNRGRVDKNES